MSWAVYYERGFVMFYWCGMKCLTLCEGLIGWGFDFPFTIGMEEDEPPPPGLEEGKGGDDSCAEDEDKNRRKKVDINDDKEEEDEDSKKEEKSDDDPEDSVGYIDVRFLLCSSLLNYKYW